MTQPHDISPDAPEAPHDLPHRLSWRVGGVRPGAHRGKIPGSGGVFRDLVPLIQAPDPRRIDLRASLRDPWNRIYARRFEQHSAAPVYALVDLSASMGFTGAGDRMAMVAQLVAALAASVRRIGDPFGVIGCDDDIQAPFDVPATPSRAGERALVERLAAYRPRRRAGAGGLIDASRRLSERRKLVFLISDFRLPEDALEAVFARLSPHDVVPVVLRDAAEVEDLPDWRLVRLEDLETGAARLVLTRPALKAAWRTAEASRRHGLRRLTLSLFGCEPFVVSSRIDWLAFSDYLMTGRM